MKPALLSMAVATSLAALVLAGPLACSFSNSSASSADSSGSSAKSSGSSSGKEGSTALFQQDVEQYTALYVEEGGRDESAFLTGVGDLARHFGVSDWEAEPLTWEAIGRGLERSARSEAERNAYAQAWTDGDADRVRALGRGSATAR